MNPIANRVKPNSPLLSHLLALLLLLSTLVQAQPADESLKQLSPGVFETELILSPSLEPRRAEFESVLVKAQERLFAFASKYEWDHLMEEPLMHQAFLFDSKPGYDEFLRKLYPDAKDMQIPSTFTAGFHDDVFFAVAPELYAQLVPQFVEDDFYAKLLAHELAHRLHTKIVNGNEDKMGPIWFWEGFATVASGQFKGHTKQLKQTNIESLLNNPKRGDYRDYNALTKHFLQVVPLPELVRRSYQEGFAEWLLENANPKS